MINMKRTPLELTPERPGMKSQTTPRIQKKRPEKKHWFFTRRFWARLRKCDTVVHFEGSKKWFFNKHPVKFKGPNPRKSKKHGFVTHSVYSTKRKSSRRVGLELTPERPNMKSQRPCAEISFALFQNHVFLHSDFRGVFRIAILLISLRGSKFTGTGQEEEEVYIKE